MKTFHDPEFEPTDGKRLSRTGRRLIKQWRADSFRCVHCGFDVPMEAVGSQNRNHCPLCLWSRHVDEAIGDRRATCLASMEPLGLTRKAAGGELMLVHVCRGCAKVSTNRLAGDDNAAAIENLIVDSCKQKDLNLEKAPGILFEYDADAVQRDLYGA